MKMFKLFYVLLMFSSSSQLLAGSTPELTLSMAITQAQNNDLWRVQNKHTQAAISAQQIAAGTWQDPKVAMSINNLPSNDLAFNQDNMSQLKVSMSQAIPRGDSLQIKQHILTLEAQQQPILRAEREAKVAMAVSELWLDAYAAKMTIELISKDAHLFEQLVEISEANYASALGKTRQHDVIRAQLELAQLQDRLAVEQQRLVTQKAKLLNWLPEFDASLNTWQLHTRSDAFEISKALPTDALFLSAMASIKTLTRFSDNTITRLMHHPTYLAQSKQIESAKQTVSLFQQKYQPQWGVNASYGYRGDHPSGLKRHDLLSVGVSFDLPLFTENKQDKEVLSAQYRTEALKTAQLLTLKELGAGLATEQQAFRQLQKRLKLYKTTILEQSHQQSEAALSAYNNDDGDFNTAVQAKITELNARIAILNIHVEKLKTLTRINYYLAGNSASTDDATGVSNEQ
ncbi:TolC family protein [Pseudoalteromonas sp. MMG012]|uniref:TolC family protein n=1 Tax=Pseudoalteromonas sp. MMG012 TaxID=2822686 RepID=UPI001B39F472|nr:TolC family protein [Pseudoalteromonas sp. MMG012]MBQ4850814.1 TolC family protein [Pseudoalteromonas sp. MMG012]